MPRINNDAKFAWESRNRWFFFSWRNPTALVRWHIQFGMLDIMRQYKHRPEPKRTTTGLGWPQ